MIFHSSRNNSKHYYTNWNKKLQSRSSVEIIRTYFKCTKRDSNHWRYLFQQSNVIPNWKLEISLPWLARAVYHGKGPLFQIFWIHFQMLNLHYYRNKTIHLIIDLLSASAPLRRASWEPSTIWSFERIIYYHLTIVMHLTKSLNLKASSYQINRKH